MEIADIEDGDGNVDNDDDDYDKNDRDNDGRGDAVGDNVTQSDNDHNGWG